MKTYILILALATSAALPPLAAAAQERGLPDFATLDADGDGLITQEELQAAGDARFAAADTDGDGALSAEELQARIVANAGDRAAQGATRMIERLDANEDGLLQREEIAERGGDRMERMFDRADSDDDGAISAEEFAEVAERRGDHRGGHGGKRGEGRR